ncbi:MAG: beta-ketoacyl-[acyl-carrier-protein] synthase family protein [Candidatus Hydrogenedentota bacterium]
MGHQVAITGMGIISCLGLNLADVSHSLQNGRSGIMFDEERVKAGFRSPLTGKIVDFDPENWGLKRKHLKTMGEPAQYGYTAALDAIADAGLDDEQIQNPRCGIVMGNDSVAGATVEGHKTWEENGATRSIGSGYIFQGMNSTVTRNLATYLGIQGASWTLAGACASGAHAIGQGCALIRSGLQDIVLVGGAQETNYQSMGSFDALTAFSTRLDSPTEASRPFDVDCDGLVPSGGGACLILEDLEYARQRGARVYGIVRGYGFSTNGTPYLSRPDANGAARAMRMALDDAKISPATINYVNAHATSTPLGDAAEATAIAQTLGTQIPVSSTKSMTGHECWMGGASEVIYTTLMARDKFLAPNINFTRMREDCPAININHETRSMELKYAMSDSFGFGGTNASLVLDYSDMQR